MIPSEYKFTTKQLSVKKNVYHVNINNNQYMQEPNKKGQEFKGEC